MARLFPALQKLGRSLMLPIAVLPVAGLLLRLGQPDLLDMEYVAAAGNAVFANLGLLFAIGVAVGLARENNGAAGVAAVVAYLVTTEGARVLIDVPPDALAGAVELTLKFVGNEYKSAAIAKMSVPAGLICGILAGILYNRYADIRLPDYLAFFAGKRFVPIVSGFAALPVAALFGLGWPSVESGMNTLSGTILGAGEIGLFAYGCLNRLLIITGLHHILNNLAWFIVGDFDGVTGDLRRFFAGDPDAGAFMSGFFPVMMFGLPAACLAMYRSARPDRRLAVGGLYVSMALTSFLTGITEPIEFTFMFLAPLLYAVHAVLTGMSMVIMDLLGIRLGFGFSAGFFDYVLNFNRATLPLLVLPVGAAYFAAYYFLFRICIVRFDLPVPGREPAAAQAGEPATAKSGEADAFVEALGGVGNLLDVDACMTRLRLRVASQDAVDEPQLKALGAAGIVRPAADALQVVVGPRADEIASGIRAVTGARAAESSGVPDSPATAAASPPQPFEHGAALVAALGGAANISCVEAFGSRLSVVLHDAGLADEGGLTGTGLRGLAFLPGDRVHVLADDEASAIGDAVDDVLKTAHF